MIISMITLPFYKMIELEEVLITGTSEEKIGILENLASTNILEIIKKIISCLDDPDIKVRGEAFSSLILNQNNISQLLLESLKDPRKNVRGYVALVLANRNDSNAISAIVDLLKDESSMVRSCALGSLGHLKAKQAKDVIRNYIFDSNLEVKKSALQALINIKEKMSEKELLEIKKEQDAEIESLVVKLKKGGPEGI